MSLAHRSIATINSPQFINLQPIDINPLMSSCDIKVFYLGKNRNGSFISKEVATEMAKTLRGAPIVGYYKDSKQDFADHGEQMIWDDEGIHFNCLTKPYGFVAPDAKVWFKDFQDFDEFGNKVERTYLMTTGYLWTGQFKEAQQILNEDGKPQSMELDGESVEGHWSTDIKDNVEFFIISDAIFSKLCILGDDVEPCFEGASITSPQVSSSFTLDNNFKNTLFEMMKELKYVLEGGDNTVTNPNEQEVQAVVEDPITEDFSKEEEKNEDNGVQFEAQKNEEIIEQQGESAEKYTQEEQEGTTESSMDSTTSEYTLLEEKYNELEQKYSLLEQECVQLRTFKSNIENEKKDSLIAEFSMLSDQDKKDVVENKAKYSLDEIKSKLAVICFEKKVNFNLDKDENKEEEKEEEASIIFNVNEQTDSTPDWVKAVELTMNNKF